jgi:hypothetical protein
MRIDDQIVQNRINSVFMTANSEHPRPDNPTTLFNLGAISHVEITSPFGSPAECRVWFANGRDYYLRGHQADSFLASLRDCGAWPETMAATATDRRATSTGGRSMGS